MIEFVSFVDYSMWKERKIECGRMFMTCVGDFLSCLGFCFGDALGCQVWNGLLQSTQTVPTAERCFGYALGC